MNKKEFKIIIITVLICTIIFVYIYSIIIIKYTAEIEKIKETAYNSGKIDNIIKYNEKYINSLEYVSKRLYKDIQKYRQSVFLNTYNLDKQLIYLKESIKELKKFEKNYNIINKLK